MPKEEDLDFKLPLETIFPRHYAVLFVYITSNCAASCKLPIWSIIFFVLYAYLSRIMGPAHQEAI